MLQKYIIHEPGADGFAQIGPELEDTPCVVCGGESVPNACPGDGRWHHHGCVHTVDHKLVPVCSEHIKTIDMAWTALRTKRADERLSRDTDDLNKFAQKFMPGSK